MSSYLFGRERRVVDVPTDHPSCSKQHAVLQFRWGGAPGRRAGLPGGRRGRLEVSREAAPCAAKLPAAASWERFRLALSCACAPRPGA